ncbi:hypothetical protein C6P45_003688 [Maudiozyma exigua]|uniref:Uncharacterized protein n=1 Tax=Maudiozyma exigua TaxID=34358 RepID=A0A9P6WFJ2_MAUEX|nr:hypothetical protein C6P45_003688 [Kazachstania exigua]
MSGITNQFSILQKQLDAELHTLSSESKRRNPQIKTASDKSIKILKTVHNSSDLLRHPDFVVPFILASSSRNAKLTSIAIQCLQGLSSSECIPQARISEVLDGFMESTHLAMEIQLKVLQVVPIFFKTYAKYVTGELCAKLLQCCANLLQVPHKSSIVAGTASATLQQLINEIFDRLSDETLRNNTHSNNNANTQPEFEVLVNNSETIKVDTYRYDTNRLFSALFSSLESKGTGNNSNSKETNPYLNINDLPLGYGLEILESILTNNSQAFINYDDLQFTLKIKAIPLLLRSVSNSKNFSIVVRSSRCIKLLLKKEYFSVLEIELEVILSLLIHNISLSSQLPNWHRILVLEIISDISRDIEIILTIFFSYDNFQDKKHILSDLLQECCKLLTSDECVAYLGESPIIEKMDMTHISNEEMSSKTKYLQLLDKSNAPSTNHGYIIWLIMNFTTRWSEGINSLIIDNNTKQQDKKKNEETTAFYKGVFPDLYKLFKKFLYSTAIDSHLFHSLVRAFQKLGYSAGILALQGPLDECYETFSIAIVNNVEYRKDDLKNDANDTNDETQVGNTSGYLHAISETLIGTTSEEVENEENDNKKKLHKRSFNSKQISLFRALISLSISLGSTLSANNWQHMFVTWQWVSYYIYGPSIDFMESSYSEDIPSAPAISKTDISSIENAVLQLFESTSSYPSASFQTLLRSLIEQSQEVLFKKNVVENYAPISTEITIKGCIYNKGFYITQIGEISTYNYNRFLTGPKGKDSWNLVMEYFIALISNRSIESSSLRLYITRVFTDILKNATEEVSHTSETERSNKKFNVLEDFVMCALMDTMDSMGKLTISGSEIYKGTLNTESEILLQILSTLKGILNEFGEALTHSWLTIFKVINSPFELLNYDTMNLNEDDSEKSALTNAVFQKRSEMIQISYDVFKLISDDFLQSLPLDIIRYVIDTLVNFVSQDRNLNISFSSISQFWLVGDYLRSKKTPECQLKENYKTEFIGELSSGNILGLISSEDKPLCQVYNGLWIYLLKNLTKCSTDRRTEVKNGAMQTFFRIVDTHANCLPPWNIIFDEVLYPMLINVEAPDKQQNYMECYDIAMKGYLKLYPIHFAQFNGSKEELKPWLSLEQFLEGLFSSPDVSIKYIAIKHYAELLKVIGNISNIPEAILEQAHDIWTGYKIIYGDNINSDPFNNKSEYDCVLELINAFPLLYKLMLDKGMVTERFVSDSLSVFNTASRYPLLPEHSSDSKRPSTLQKSILDSLELFNKNQSPNTELLLLFQITKICTLTFYTREKIEQKLGSRFKTESSSRVPTFEAVSYRACEILYERLDSLDENTKMPLEKEKYIIKILGNLSDIIRRKSAIGMVANQKPPIWILTSRSFRSLISLVFKDSTDESVSLSFKEETRDIFIEALTNTVDRETHNKELLSSTDDVDEYSSYRDILLKPAVISSLTEDQLKYFISTVWRNSLIYQLDEIEDILVDAQPTFTEVSEQLAKTNFDEMFGSIVEPPVLDKLDVAMVCLKDLISFVKVKGIEYDKLRNTTIPFLVCRTAFVLRRFILDEKLVNKAPIPNLRRTELVSARQGFEDVINIQ